MSKHVKGNYLAISDDEGFNKIIDLKHKIQCIAGFDQNDMTVDEEDIETCENLIKEVVTTLHSWYENKLSNLKLIEENI